MWEKNEMNIKYTSCVIILPNIMYHNNYIQPLKFNALQVNLAESDKQLLFLSALGSSNPSSLISLFIFVDFQVMKLNQHDLRLFKSKSVLDKKKIAQTCYTCTMHHNSHNHNHIYNKKKKQPYYRHILTSVLWDSN